MSNYIRDGLIISHKVILWSLPSILAVCRVKGDLSTKLALQHSKQWEAEEEDWSLRCPDISTAYTLACLCCGRFARCVEVAVIVDVENGMAECIARPARSSVELWALVKRDVIKVCELCGCRGLLYHSLIAIFIVNRNFQIPAEIIRYQSN